MISNSFQTQSEDKVESIDFNILLNRFKEIQVTQAEVRRKLQKEKEVVRAKKEVESKRRQLNEKKKLLQGESNKDDKKWIWWEKKTWIADIFLSLSFLH